MAQALIMPKWGLTMTEGKIVGWLKSEGDTVEEGEPLFEVETDKITNSVEAAASGVLFQIVVPEGDVARVQEVVAIITAPDETPERIERGVIVEADTPKEKAGPAPEGAPAPEQDGDLNASPKTVAFAEAKGIDLRQVSGTGEGGRITKADVLRAMNPANAASQTSPKPDASPKKPTKPEPRHIAGTTLPMEGMRKIIAENMQASLQKAAQLTVFIEADVTEMVSMRNALREANKHDLDYRLSYNDIVSWYSCRALKLHPIINSTLQDDGIHLHECVNLGFAVALPDGLIVPNVKQADAYSLEELAVKIRDTARRARKGGLSMDEISGGTFTISNVSMLGVDGFTPILNPPETGILGVGRVIEKPAVYEGTVCIRKMMTLSLTFNHMTTDGAPAMNFLRTLADMLENPALVLA